jgi:hypothetical protein
MKKIIIILVAFSATLTVCAQSSFLKKINYGIEVGTNISSINFSGRIEDSKLLGTQPSTKLAYQLGAFANYDINKRFMVETGLDFISKGYILPTRAISRNGLPIIKYRETLSSYYLELPLLFGVKYSIGDVNLNLKLGPYFAYGLDGSIKVEDITGTVSKDAFGGDNLYPMKCFDCGGKLALGAKLWKVSFDIFYDLGLMNIANYDDSKFSSSDLATGTFENDKAHTYTLGFTARYNF